MSAGKCTTAESRSTFASEVASATIASMAGSSDVVS